MTAIVFLLSFVAGYIAGNRQWMVSVYDAAIKPYVDKYLGK